MALGRPTPRRGPPWLVMLGGSRGGASAILRCGGAADAPHEQGPLMHRSRRLRSSAISLALVVGVLLLRAAATAQEPSPGSVSAPGAPTPAASAGPAASVA